MRAKRCDAVDWGLLKSLFKMAASVEIGDSLEELEELFLQDITDEFFLFERGQKFFRCSRHIADVNVTNIFPLFLIGSLL